MSFTNRVLTLPHLGLGVSTEFGAHRGSDSLDIAALQQNYPEFAAFLEVGVENEKGLDEDTLSWVASGGKTTYHFLDVNLEDPQDFDASWLASLSENIARLNPAWMCGDAGLWHVGPRHRSTMLLLPPILSPDAIGPMADGIVRLREETGLEVLPENPPGALFLGPLHLLDFFAQVAEEADTGLLLDAAHLAIYQRSKGYTPTTGLDEFPMDRVVEIHIAGAKTQTIDGFSFVEDDHTPNVLPDTWDIAREVISRAPNLKAVVFECERNPLEVTLPGFQKIQELLDKEGIDPLWKVPS